MTNAYTQRHIACSYSSYILTQKKQYITEHEDIFRLVSLVKQAVFVWLWHCLKKIQAETKHQNSIWIFFLLSPNANNINHSVSHERQTTLNVEHIGLHASLITTHTQSLELLKQKTEHES